MIRYKLAIRWGGGTVEGIIGEGHDETQALDNALKELMKLCDKKGENAIFGVRWSIIKPADVYDLAEVEQDKLKSDWEDAISRLDRWHNPWP